MLIVMLLMLLWGELDSEAAARGGSEALGGSL